MLRSTPRPPIVAGGAGGGDERGDSQEAEDGSKHGWCAWLRGLADRSHWTSDSARTPAMGEHDRKEWLHGATWEQGAG